MSFTMQVVQSISDFEMISVGVENEMMCNVYLVRRCCPNNPQNPLAVEVGVFMKHEHVMMDHLNRLEISHLRAPVDA